MFKITLAGVIGLAQAAWAGLAAHDSTGTLSNPSSSMADQLGAVGPAMKNAGANLVELGLTSVLGPQLAADAEAALPLLESIAHAVAAKQAAFAAPAAAGASGQAA